MSLTELQRPPGAASTAAPDGLDVCQSARETLTLAELPVGSRLVLRCRKDWRDACVAGFAEEKTILSVGSPSGHTYRVRRDSALLVTLEGNIPVLGEGSWRAGRVRYDQRW